MRTRKKLKKVAVPKVEGISVDESMDPSATLVSVLQQDGRIDRVKAAFSRAPSQNMTIELLTPAITRELTDGEKAILTPDRIAHLFRLMDVSKKGFITWDIFTSFIVDAAILAKLHHERVENLARWDLGDSELPVSSHRPWKLKHMESQNSLLVVDGSNFIFVLDCETNQTRRLAAEIAVSMIDAEFVPTEDLYAIATAGSELLLYDPHLNAMQGVKVPVALQCLCWNRGARLLCSGDRDGTLSTWHCERTPTDKVRAPILRNSWTLHSAPIVVIDCHHEVGTIAVGFLDGHVIVVHPTTGRRERVFHAGGNLNCLAISEHQNSIICGTSNTDPGVWTLGACDESKPFPLQSRANPHVSPVVSVLCFPHSAQAISTDFSGILKIWDLRTFTCLQTFQLRTRDPKVCWQYLVHSVLCDAVYFCDRKSIMCLTQLNEAEQHAKKGYVSHIMASALTGKILSTNINSLCVWDPDAGQLLAEVDNICEGDITALAVDEDGGRIFLGTASGAVWVLNAANAGVQCRFPAAHNCEVAAICYLRHANVSVSCSVDGVGSILKPPQLAFQSDSMSLRTQPAFRCMTGKLCEYIGDPNFFVLAADAQCAISVYDCKTVKITSSIVHLFNIPFPAADIRGEGFFKPRGRSIIASLPIGSFACIVCDSYTVTVFDMQGARRAQDANIWTRWFGDPSGEVTISGVAIDGATPDGGCIFVSDDSGLLSHIDLRPLFRGDGTPVVDAKLRQAHPITCIATAPGGVVLGLADGSVDYIRHDSGYLSVWNNSTSRAQAPVSTGSLQFVQSKLGVKLGRNAGRRQQRTANEVRNATEVVVDEQGYYQHRQLARTNSMIKNGSSFSEKNSSASLHQHTGVSSGDGFGHHAGRGSGQHNSASHSKEWVLAQLSTLCADYTYVENEFVATVARPAFYTPTLRIPVFIDSDPFSSVMPAEGLDSAEDSVNVKRMSVASSDAVKDKRGSSDRERLAQRETPAFLKVRRFVGCTTDKLDSLNGMGAQSSASSPSRTESQQHTLLRPLRPHDAVASAPLLMTRPLTSMSTGMRDIGPRQARRSIAEDARVVKTVETPAWLRSRVSGM